MPRFAFDDVVYRAAVGSYATGIQLDVGAQVYVYTNAARTVQANVYADETTTIPLAQPRTPTGRGRVLFYLDPGRQYFGRAGDIDFEIVAPPMASVYLAAYGAGHGSASLDTAAWGEAMTKLPSGGGEVIVPNATLLINASGGQGLTASKEIQLKGEGRASVIAANGAMTYLLRLLISGARHIGSRVQDVQLMANGAAVNGLLVDAAHNVVVDHVHFIDFLGWAATFTAEQFSNSEGHLLANVTAFPDQEASIGNGYRFIAGATGILTDSTVMNAKVEQLTGIGLLMEDAQRLNLYGGHVASDVAFTAGLVIRNPGSAAGALAAGYEQTGEHFINGFYCEDQAGDTATAVLIDGQAASGSGRTLMRCQVQGLRAENCLYAARLRNTGTAAQQSSEHYIGQVMRGQHKNGFITVDADVGIAFLRGDYTAAQQARIAPNVGRTYLNGSVL